MSRQSNLDSRRFSASELLFSVLAIWMAHHENGPADAEPTDAEPAYVGPADDSELLKTVVSLMDLDELQTTQV